jgi:hypothetical protein
MRGLRMKINDIKKEMLKFEDFYGGDLLNISDIEKSKTKRELAEIIENHRSHMESMLCDAQRHLDNFKRKLGI